MSDASRIMQQLEEIQKRVDKVQETLTTAKQLIVEHFELNSAPGETHG